VTTTTLLVAAGAVVLLWPIVAKIFSLPVQRRPASLKTLEQVLSSAGGKIPKPLAPSQPQSFEAALAALAALRRRLSDTQQLDEETKAAIEKVTQKLVAGSQDE
jgi:hypothetical protein